MDTATIIKVDTTTTSNQLATTTITITTKTITMPPVKSATAKIMNSPSHIGTLTDNRNPTTTTTTTILIDMISFNTCTCKMK